MKHFLACLALCASLSASAQGDNCTVLGIQDLTQMVFQLQTQLNAQDATIDSLQNAAMTRDSVIAIAIHKELSIDEVTGGDLSTIYLAGANLGDADLRGANLGG
ncbi:MAG: pentapeptide repeat-containing protein, partial [Flavobacteriales bacterium]|nr:pentapeptide repeat-containing protein [Flavobacteriales bacterium]